MSALYNRFVMLALLSVLGLFPPGAIVAQDPGQATGLVASTQGGVRVQRGSVSYDARIGTPVYQGDLIRTGPADNAKLVFEDDTVIDVGPATELHLELQDFAKKSTLLDLRNGRIRLRIGNSYDQGERSL